MNTTANGCVFVVGMHRSGTSATAEVLGRLGLASPSPDELVPATSANQRGHFEAKTLVRLNDRLLTALGGTWSAPPPLAAGWERADSLHELRIEAEASFATVFPTRPAAWKDPRNCIVLPFWLSVVGPGSAAVFVYRDPLEVARSLESRNDLRLTLGLALWERYARDACANLEGVPTFCTDFRRVLDDPEQWCREMVDFLAGRGERRRCPTAGGDHLGGRDAAPPARRRRGRPGAGRQPEDDPRGPAFPRRSPPSLALPRPGTGARLGGRRPGHAPGARPARSGPSLDAVLEGLPGGHRRGTPAGTPVMTDGTP